MFWWASVRNASISVFTRGKSSWKLNKWINEQVKKCGETISNKNIKDEKRILLSIWHYSIDSAPVKIITQFNRLRKNNNNKSGTCKAGKKGKRYTAIARTENIIKKSQPYTHFSLSCKTKVTYAHPPALTGLLNQRPSFYPSIPQYIYIYHSQLLCTW